MQTPPQKKTKQNKQKTNKQKQKTKTKQNKSKTKFVSKGQSVGRFDILSSTPQSQTNNKNTVCEQESYWKILL